MCDGAVSVLQILLCLEHFIPPTRAGGGRDTALPVSWCDEAALGRGESGEGGTAFPCKSPRSGQ